MVDKRNPPRSKAKKPSGASAAVSSESANSSPTGCTGWEWWRASREPGSRSAPKEDYDNPRKIPVAVRAEFDLMRRRYKAGGLRNGANIKFIGDGIYELKYSHIGNTPYRLLFMRWGPWAVGLDVFKKTTNVTPKAVALKRRQAWLKLFGKEP